jgi:hypothetical protein
MKVIKDIKSTQIKKVWSKPRLLSGKEIGFFGLGHVQTTPSTDFS